MTTTNTDSAAAPAALRTAARRLRYLRRYPVSTPYGPEVRDGMSWACMSYAYEHALRVLIDEFGARSDFHALFYGPQGEDPDGVREAGQ